VASFLNCTILRSKNVLTHHNKPFLTEKSYADNIREVSYLLIKIFLSEIQNILLNNTFVAFINYFAICCLYYN